MNKRNSPRLLPGPDTSMFSLRKQESGAIVRGTLLDESDEGLAFQLGRSCPIDPNDRVDVLVGETWEPAIVTSARRQGIANRVGLRWIASCETPAHKQSL